MSVSLRVINNEVVKAIKHKTDKDEEDKRPFKGYKLFPVESKTNLPSIFLCAKKRSGKTSAIFKIIKSCCDKHTVLVIFSSTYDKDKNWTAIRKYCKHQHIQIEPHTALNDEGVDILDIYVKRFKKEAEEKRLAEEEISDDESEEEPLENLMFPESDSDDEPRKRKSKYWTPPFFFIFDDMSSELKAPSVSAFLKVHRHYAMCLFSSQWCHDLKPESLKQIDYWLLWKSFTEEKLVKLYKDCDLSIPFDLFMKMYKMATGPPYSFFYINAREEDFRMNFNVEFDVEQVKQQMI